MFGKVRDALRKRGIDAISCDIQPDANGSKHHVQDDVLKLIDEPWDLVIAHPPCTYLANSSVQWLFRTPPNPTPGILYEAPRLAAMRSGGEFFKRMLKAKRTKRLAVENPIPHKYGLKLIGRKYDQIIQPYMFGHKEIKQTCLWLENLPPLVATNMVGPPPRDLDLTTAEGRAEHASWRRIHRVARGADRAKLRSETYQGIADAIADQWGGLLKR